MKCLENIWNKRSKEKGRIVMEKNIIEVKNIDSDIYELMKDAFLQIGSYSTAIYEGLKFRFAYSYN